MNQHNGLRAFRALPAAAMLLIPGAMVILAFAIRVRCIDCQSLWLDEATSAYWTTIPLRELFLDTADNLHVPAYFLLLRAWVALVGLSPFSLRYFSLAGGILLVPMVYCFSRRFLGNRAAGLLAALLAALSPAHIYYSQETRMYAFLPVLYLIMLGLVLDLQRVPRRLSWAWLVGLQLLALYMHLFTALMILALNLLLAFAYWRRRSTAFLSAWLGSQLLVALALLPWLWFTWLNGGALPANLGDTSGGLARFSFGEYLAQIWIFLATGLTGARSFLQDWSMLLALVLGLTLVATVATTAGRRRSVLLALLAAFAAPLLAGAIAWRFNPLTHPRYLLFLLAPALVLSGYALAWLFDRRYLAPIPAAVLVLVVLIDASAVRAWQSDAEQRRYDSAALAAAISRRAGANDVALMPPFDRALWYYDPAPVHAANWPFAAGQQDWRAAQVQQLLDGYHSAFLVEYHDLYSYDPHRQLPFLLEANGRLLEEFTVDRMDVYHYALSTWQTPQLAPVDYRCGPLQLTGVYFPSRIAPGDAPAVSLRWRLLESTGYSFVASARLMDGERQLSAEDRPLLDDEGARTASWSPGDEGVANFILPFPLGTPPLPYDLRVLLYAEGGVLLTCETDDGDGLRLGQIALTEADQRLLDAYGSWSDTLWQTPPATTAAPGLELEGFDVRPRSIRPGQPLYVTLKWRATTALQREVNPELLLIDDHAPVDQAAGDLFRRYPTSRWREGDVFVETLALEMHPTLRPLQLVIAAGGERLLTLGEVRVDTAALSWSVPPQATPLCAEFLGVGALRGVEWQQTGDGIEATLYWQAAAGAPRATSYTIFAQLLTPDAGMLAQHDGLPAGGERPTTTWLPGEVIADRRSFQLPPNVEGQARLNVGFYELASLQRVAAFDCQGRRLTDDAFSIALSQQAE